MRLDPDEDPAIAQKRREMVVEQLARRGIKDERVLATMALLPRHRFVAPELADLAYEDRPLPIGFGQTISQPYMVGRVTELAAPRSTDRTLEVGAGCGYQLAVVADLCERAFGAEIVPELAARASDALGDLGIKNAIVQCFDGSAGWPDYAPFDVIIVSAGAPRVPPLLVDQLADGGRMVIPIGAPEEQELAVIRRQGDSYSTTFDTRCRYVDLMGRYGFGGTPPLA
jgi:protein-L-isoaspartate(D-aspartate) O-methyltransferase